MDNQCYEPFRRIEAHTGLVIDAETWSIAHAYHDAYQQTHMATLHGWGIARGLNVSVDVSANAVLISPGIAIDSRGRMIVVPSQQRLTADLAGPESYLVLSLVDRRNNGDDSAQVDEGFELALSSEKPLPSAVCLGRIATIVKKPSFDPLGRVEMRSFRDRLVSVLLTSDEAEMHGWHMRGLENLLNSSIQDGIHAALTRDDSREVNVAYITGSASVDPPATTLRYITSRAKGSSTVIIDLCKPGRVSVAWKELIDGLKRDAGEWQMQVLRSPHVFGDGPAGADPNGELYWLPNGIVSLRDFGCAWAGRGDAGALPRTIIRDALEFGANLLAASRQS